MFVIADIEWAENRAYMTTPTQLSAVRVDNDWNVVDSFNSLIRPRDSSFHIWHHVSYNSGKASDFLGAESAFEVLTEFSQWCMADDVIVWWHKNSSDMFKKLNGIILKKFTFPNMIIANKYVYSFLPEEALRNGCSVYRIAQAVGLEPDMHSEHCAENDVLVLLSLLKKANSSQKAYLKPIKKKVNIQSSDTEKRYIYDKETGVLHGRSCPCIKGKTEGVKGYNKLDNVIKKKYKVCSCIADEYNKALAERNTKIIQSSEYNYIYLPSSDVFHKHSCKTFLHSVDFYGTATYYGAIKTGRKPCKICNPTPNDKLRFIPKTKKRKEIKQFNISQMSKEDRKAINKQKLFAKVRKEKLQNDNLSEQERNDIYTLTKPHFAFWAGKGYGTFHLHSCPKLHGLSNLEGFQTYEEAFSAGYRPCKTCRPSKKQDIKISIPITNEIHFEEKVSDIEKMCIDADFDFSCDSTYIYIQTPTGKWKINSVAYPVKVWHINMIRNPSETDYHEQPRRFLSLTDIFKYIERHDESLLEKIS